MLCPDCQRPTPGGALCSQCGHPVPERESFSGQGDHYLRLLSAFSLVFVVVILLVGSRGTTLRAAFHALYGSKWFWFDAATFLIPIGVGFYYWFMLREEEIVITDEDITRHSRWGDERLAWAEVQAFRCPYTPFRNTRLGRIAGLSQWFTERKLFLKQPSISCELIGPPDTNGDAHVMRLEPGTIEDMPWLIRLIEERIGPAQEV